MLKNSSLVILILLLTAFYTNAQNLIFSSDGKTLAANWAVKYGDYNTTNQFLFFDVATGKIKSSINVSNETITDPVMSFAPGNQSLLFGDRSGTASINLTADNKTELKDFESQYQDYDKLLLGIYLSSDGKTLYKLFADELIAYNFLTQKVIPEQGKKIQEGTDSQFVAMDPGGQFLAEIQKKERKHTLIIHNLAKKTSEKIELPYIDEDGKKVRYDAQMSDNGERLALEWEIDEEKSQLTVWDVKSRTSLGAFAVSSLESQDGFYKVESFSFSPDGKKLAVKINDFEDGNAKDLLFLWDVAAKKEILSTAKKYSEELFADNFVFSPDSKQLAVSSQVLLPNSFSLKVQLVDVNTGTTIREF